MQPDDKLIRASLAALARRAGVGLVVTRAEIEHELDGDTRVRIGFDKDADCYRISIPEVAS